MIPQGHTIFILDLRGAGEDPVGNFHSSPWPKVRPIHFSLFAQLGQDLGGLHGVTPGVVPMAGNRRVRSEKKGWEERAGFFPFAGKKTHCTAKDPKFPGKGFEAAKVKLQRRLDPSVPLLQTPSTPPWLRPGIPSASHLIPDARHRPVCSAPISALTSPLFPVPPVLPVPPSCPGLLMTRSTAP